MADIRIKVDPAQVSVGDFMDLEDTPTMRRLHDFLVRFVVDAQDQPLPYDAASQEVRALSLQEMMQVIKSATEYVTDSAVPPQTASN